MTGGGMAGGSRTGTGFVAGDGGSFTSGGSTSGPGGLGGGTVGGDVGGSGIWWAIKGTAKVTASPANGWGKPVAASNDPARPPEKASPSRKPCRAAPTGVSFAQAMADGTAYPSVSQPMNEEKENG
jgi:hypothetical protein